MIKLRDNLDDFYRSINVGGMVIILSKVIGSSQTINHECSETQNNILDDYAFISGLCANIITFVLYKIIRKREDKENHLYGFHLANDEITDAVETMGFILLARTEGIELTMWRFIVCQCSAYGLCLLYTNIILTKVLLGVLFQSINLHTCKEIYSPLQHSGERIYRFSTGSSCQCCDI